MKKANRSSSNTSAKQDGSAPETKAQKFVRLAPKRVNKALAAIEGLGKLSAAGYEYTPEQVDKIFSAIGAAAEASFRKFQSQGKAAKKDQFTL